MSQQAAPSDPGMDRQSQGSMHNATQDTTEKEQVSVETAATDIAVPEISDPPIEAKLVSCVAVMACMEYYPHKQVLEAAKEIHAVHGMEFKAVDIARLIQEKEDKASTISMM